MPYHPDHLARRRWPLAILGLLLVCASMLYVWSFSSGKRRVSTAPAPVTAGGAAVAPPGIDGHPVSAP